MRFLTPKIKPQYRSHRPTTQNSASRHSLSYIGESTQDFYDFHLMAFADSRGYD